MLSVPVFILPAVGSKLNSEKSIPILSTLFTFIVPLLFISEAHGLYVTSEYLFDIALPVNG